jgi:hypothetical protein
MQLLNTINLSIVASLLLQSGRFVGAMPLFGARVDNAHSNGVSENTCQGKLFTCFISCFSLAYHFSFFK